MDLIHSVRAFIAEHKLIPPGGRVAAAVSGGSDSMALAHVLGELDRRGVLKLVAILHFNHQLRPQADADQRFVAAAARDLGVPLRADRADVAAISAREKRSLEDAGRRARHDFFRRACVEAGADCVALGHTRDDQAETFLLRLIRGAGPRGLSAMHPRSGIAVRPLLDCRRDDLRTFLAERQIAFVDDETNADATIPRNRVRAELVPLLAARFNPSIVDALADEAAVARELWLWLEEASAPLHATPGVLDIAALRAAPPPLRRLTIWRALSAASGGRHISFDHVAAVIRLMQSERTDGHLDMPGQSVQRIGDRIVLTEERGSWGSKGSWGSRGSQGSKGSEGSEGSGGRVMRLAIPGEARDVERGYTISAVEAVLEAGATLSSTASVAFVRRDLIAGSLGVRNRRPGDKFRPVGLRGSKKLQDLFVDAKVPRAEREAVPVVVDHRDRIVWVAGFGIDEAFRVTDSSQAVLVLRLTRS